MEAVGIFEPVFIGWFARLKKYMYLQQDFEGMRLDPDGWCEKETWLKHYNNKLSPEEAYYAEA